MTAAPRPTVRLRQIGANLRSLREAAGIDRDQAGDAIGVTGATIARYEKAETRPRVAHVTGLLALYEVADEQKTALINLTRKAGERGWWTPYDAGFLGLEAIELFSLETEAASIRNYEFLLIPGLLQTREYAQAIVEGHNPTWTEEAVETTVALRLARQDQLLRREHPPKVSVILNEAALRSGVGGHAVMTEQLGHLSEVVSLSQIVLRVLPLNAGAHPGMTGPFVVLEFAELNDLDVVHIENLGNSLYLEEEAEVERYSTAFQQLSDAALDTEASLALISEIAKETAR